MYLGTGRPSLWTLLCSPTYTGLNLWFLGACVTALNFGLRSLFVPVPSSHLVLPDLSGVVCYFSQPDLPDTPNTLLDLLDSINDLILHDTHPSIPQPALFPP